VRVSPTASNIRKEASMAKKKPIRRVSPARARIQPRSSRWYGWVPDLPDHRDRMYQVSRPLETLPPNVDLRSACPDVYDQGDLGSCTANAIAGALEFDQMKQQTADVFPPSRLFIYYNERVMENTVDDDAGAMIRDGIKSVAKLGAPHEAIWPYAIAKFKIKPNARAFKDATRHRAVLYQRLTPTLQQLKGCLAEGYPFVFGFSVYDTFESDAVAKTGIVPMPKPKEKQLGGHAVMAVGYDDATERFLVRNSWGPKWAIAGYFTMPYAYLTDDNLADDFWTIKQI
jgi:C1A family cysteine protease